MKLKEISMNLKEISISLLEISKELDDMWKECLTDEEIKEWDNAVELTAPIKVKAQCGNKHL